MDFIPGICAGISQTIVGHPIDTIKVLIQNKKQWIGLPIKDYYRGLVGHKRVYQMRSLMITDNIKLFLLTIVISFPLNISKQFVICSALFSAFILSKVLLVIMM